MSLPTSTPRSQRTAVLSALGAVLLWSTVATAFKLTLRVATVLDTVVIASVTSTLALWMVVLIRTGRSSVRDWTRRDWGLSFILGVLNPVAYYLVLFSAYDVLPAQIAQPLNYGWPIVLTLFTTLRRGVWPTRRDRLGMAISFGGVILIATKGEWSRLHFDSPLGVGLALGSTVLWALYWELNGRDSRDAVTRLAVNFLVGSLVLLVIKSTQGNWATLGSALPGGVYIGLFEMGVTFVLWMRAVRTAIHPARVNTLVFLSPFLSLVFIGLVLDEAILFATWIGLAAIVTGIFVQRTHRNPEGPDSALT